MGSSRSRSDWTPTYAPHLLLNDTISVKKINGVWQQVFSTAKIQSGNTTVETRDRFMTDVVTPHYRKRIAKGEVINSPMESRVSVKTNALADVRAEYLSTNEYGAVHSNTEPYYTPGVFLTSGQVRYGTYPSSEIHGRAISHIPTASIDAEALKALAVTQAHANVDRSDAQMLMMLAEGEKTISSLKDIFLRAVRLFRIYNKIIRLQRLTRKERKYVKENFSVKELQNRYMEVRYSLRPLLYDAKQVCKALEPLQSFDRFTFRGFAEETTESHLIHASKALSTTKTSVVPISRTKRHVEVRAGVLTSIDCDTVLNRWGFDQPIETLWEVIPFSFVADWFFNIGQTIAAHTPEIGTRELASWAVTRTTLETEMTVLTSSPNYGSYDISLSNCIQTLKDTTVIRETNPPLAFFPRVKVRLDGLKLLDLAIILKNLSSDDKGRQRLSRKMY